MGYHREDVCEQFGHFSLKGGILDIYTPFLPNPVRIDFFGDTVDEIRTYDPNTQKSLEKIPSIVVTQANECISTKEELTDYKLILTKEKDKRHPIDSEFDIIEEHLPLVREHQGILELFANEPILVFPKFSDSKERAYGMDREYKLSTKKRRRILSAFRQKHF